MLTCAKSREMGRKGRVSGEKSKSKACPFALMPVRHRKPWNILQDGKVDAKTWHFQGTPCLSSSTSKLFVGVPWSRCRRVNLLCHAGRPQPCAAFHLHWSDAGDSALPLQDAAIALLQRRDYSSSPSIIKVQLSSRDLWAGKENENYRCPVPVTEPPYISFNKACDNSFINSHSNRSECQLVIAAI